MLNLVGDVEHYQLGATVDAQAPAEPASVFALCESMVVNTSTVAAALRVARFQLVGTMGQGVLNRAELGKAFANLMIPLIRASGPQQRRLSP